MNRTLLIIPALFTLLVTISCNEQENSPSPSTANSDSSRDSENSESLANSTEPIQSLSDFVPKGYILFDTIYGDLNKDGNVDCVLVIKATDKTKIEDVEYVGELDRNRRGLIVLLKHNEKYEELLKNLNCFSSENEDGGVYFPPEMYIEIEKGKLFIRYAHGRYGHWAYTFRLNKDDFELIGYDQGDYHGPIAERIESINFLTKKRQIKENTNLYAEEPDKEVFKETWENLKTSTLLELSKIKDFDALEFSEW